ncbi:hypothetical protein BH11MYX1_BH11MYX1_41190 [soil metagenome]
MKHVLAIILLAACGGTPPLPPVRTADDAAALDALRAANFDAAIDLSAKQLAIEPRDAEAAAIRAIAGYVKASSSLYTSLDLGKHPWFLFEPLLDPKHAPPITAFLGQLDAIDQDLAIAGADPRFSLELCLACWKFDWNHDGKVDERDTQLFELDEDQRGAIPEGDPRRHPTFRFDLGDTSWARAMIAFQRAFGELVLSYRWQDLSEPKTASPLVVHLIAPERVKHARELVLAGLEHSNQARLRYLAETDDDREWVPNPSQRSYAMPLPVDMKLYDTWASVVSDVRNLVAGRTGISMQDLAKLDSAQLVAITPNAYVDLGKMLSDPTDISIANDGKIESVAAVNNFLRGVLGHGFNEHMERSPLVDRLARMAGELAQGTDTIEHKLHYLLWIN